MAGWDQQVGGQILWESDDPSSLLNESEGGELLTASEGGGWHALTIAKTALAAAFAQDATWSATAGQELEGAGGWEQTANWDAVAQTAEDVNAEATWTQSAAWAAVASQAAVATAEFSQSATWAAEGSTAAEQPEPEPEPEPPPGVRIGRTIQPISRPKPPPITAEASFGQPPAEWYGYVTVNDDALVLVLV